MCAITRDYTGHAETRLLCEEGILGPCDHCEDTAIVADEFGTLCALHVTPRPAHVPASVPGSEVDAYLNWYPYPGA